MADSIVPVLNVERAHFSLRLQSLFFPITIEDIEHWSKEHGYQLAEELQPSRRPILPSGTQFMVSGRIASNPDTRCSLSLVAERGILAIDGPSIEKALSDFDQLDHWVTTNVANLADEIRFYELILDGSLIVGKERDPIKTVGRAFSSNSLISGIGTYLRKDVTNFGMRLVEKDRSPSSDEWMEIRIEPLIARSATTYSVNLVYRHPMKDPVIEWAGKVPELVSHVIRVMEQAT